MMRMLADVTQLPALPQHADDIDREWLQRTLGHAGHDVEVAQVSVSPIGTGQMATSLRAAITYTSNLSDSPPSVVIKIASSDPNSRDAGARGAYLKEVRYYEQIDATVNVATPGWLWSDIDETTSSFVLVLQDMHPATQGDQIAGCTPEQAESAALNIAGLHAPRWGDLDLFEHRWLSAPFDERQAAYAELRPVLGPLTEGFIGRYQARLNDSHAEVLRWFAANAEAWLSLDPERFALTHADHRLDNLLFDPSADSSLAPVTVVDWQTIGLRNPLADVSYLLGTGLEPTTRREVEDDIVRRYHDRLVQLGVSDYSYSQCFDDYRTQSLHVLLITVLGSMLTGQTERGDDMFMAMLHRSCEQITDLDSRDCLA